MNMNPHHVRFVTDAEPRSLRQLFQVMDSLEPALRDRQFMMAFIEIVGLKVREPEPHERQSVTIGELIEKPINFRIFKDECKQLTNRLSEHFIVFSVVSYALAEAFHHGNEDMLPVFVRRFQQILEMSEEELVTETDPQKRNNLESMMQLSREKIAEFPEQVRQGRIDYERLCEELVKPLMDLPPEKIELP